MEKEIISKDTSSCFSSKGLMLPYVIMMLAVIMFLLMTLYTICVQELNSYQAKEDYYQVVILENRAIKMTKETINQDLAYTLKRETIFHENGRIHFIYYKETVGYQVQVTIYYKNIIQRTTIYYVKNSDTMIYKQR